MSIKHFNERFFNNSFELRNSRFDYEVTNSIIITEVSKLEKTKLLISF